MIDVVTEAKTDAKRVEFWCADATVETRRFVAGSAVGPRLVREACLPLFPARYREAIVAATRERDAAKRATGVVAITVKQLCPTLAKPPAACAANPAKLTPDAQRATVAAILEPALPIALTSFADALAAAWLR